LKFGNWIFNGEIMGSFYEKAYGGTVQAQNCVSQEEEITLSKPYVPGSLARRVLVLSLHV
jgi:hypothetical protein